VPDVTDGGARGKSRPMPCELKRAERLYERHRERLLGLAIRVLGYLDHDTADGVVQDVFGNVLSGQVRLPEDDDKAARVLSGVVKKTAQNRRRYEEVRRGQPLGPALDDHRDRGGNPCGTPWKAAESIETRGKVRAALESLPDAQREVVEMTHFEGRSRAEIAEIRGCSPETVKKLLCRGRRRIRKLLKADFSPV
jgi:RNA polymerase sigma-70 factor, ECF subfamily